MEAFFDPITGLKHGFGGTWPTSEAYAIVIAIANQKEKEAALKVAEQVRAVPAERVAVSEKFKLAAKHDPTVAMQQQTARGSGKQGSAVRKFSLEPYRRKRATKK